MFDPSDPKPGQIFVFKVNHRIHGEVAVGVFAHDNGTPGYNSADPLWSDWFGVIIEPLDGDRTSNGDPDGEDDDLFTGMGIVIHGNVMDHRK